MYLTTPLPSKENKTGEGKPVVKFSNHLHSSVGRGKMKKGWKEGVSL